ncbi:hypothetical protein ACOSOMT5_P2140 [Acidiphilium sp. MT5]
MAHPKRLELLTPRFVVWCSIQLSYGCAMSDRLADTVALGKTHPIAISHGVRPLDLPRLTRPAPLDLPRIAFRKPCINDAG